MWAALAAAIVLGSSGSWTASDEPYGATPLVRVTANELQARVPIDEISADGDRVAYWLCLRVLGAWRPGDARQVPLTARPVPFAAPRVSSSARRNTSPTWRSPATGSPTSTAASSLCRQLIVS